MGTNPTGCTEWERDYDPITEQPMTQKPKFEIGQSVYKWTGDYNGPGIVRGIAALPDGKLRYLVGHTIEGGKGELLHVYAAGNLREIDSSAASEPPMTSSVMEAVSTSSDGHEGRKPVACELLDALVEAHRQVDLLLAQVVTFDHSFMPSRSPLWPEIGRRYELIQKYGGSL